MAIGDEEWEELQEELRTRELRGRVEEEVRVKEEEKFQRRMLRTPDGGEIPAGVPAEKSRRHTPRSQNAVPYSHDALIDAMIANPAATRAELGQIFGRSAQWVYSVTSSDAFRARYEARREALIDPEIVATVKERYAALASQSMDVISDRLMAARDPILALKTLEVTTKAAAYGLNAGGPVQVNNSFVVALPEKAQSADDWAKKYGRILKKRPQDGEVVDGEVTGGSSGGSGGDSSDG